MKRSTHPRWMQTVHPNNTYIFVVKHDWSMMYRLRGLAVVFVVNRLDDILRIEQMKDQSTKVIAYVFEDSSASLESITPNPEWKNLPVILYLNRLGQYRDVHLKIEILKQLNTIVIFTGNIHQACKDAQILSSLNIHSGIRMTQYTPLDDEILELMTYSFYSVAPHAPIEPFSTMNFYYHGDNRVSPALANFENPDRYIHMDNDFHLAFSSDALERKEFFEENPDDLTLIGVHPAIDVAKHAWQSMFIESHPCTFCPAFRVCQGFFEAVREQGNCRRVMLELLESIEFSKNNNKKMELCQL